MGKIFDLICYYLLNCLSVHSIPVLVWKNHIGWVSMEWRDDKYGNYHVAYCSYLRNGNMETLFEVSDKSKYKAYMKMMSILWKNRKSIKLG